MNIVYFQSEGFDYQTSQLCEGLFLTESDYGTFRTNQANTHHGAQVGGLEVKSDEYLVNLVRDGWPHLIIYSSGGNMVNYSPEVKEVLEDPGLAHKRVFVDGHDSDALLTDPNNLLVYFKREMRIPGHLQYQQFSNVRSLTFGVYQYLFDNPLPGWDERHIDVCFMAFGGSNPTRTALVDVVKEKMGDLKTEIHVADDCQPIPMDQYHEILYSSKIGISLPGAGFDTNRYWETPGHGAVLASLEMPLYMRNAFEAGRHIISFLSWDQMVESIRAVVKCKKRWEKMRKAADKCIYLHSTRHRAKELLTISREMM